MTFVNAFEGTQEVANINPHAFDRVGIHFVDAISIIVTSLFMIGVTNGGMGTANRLVSNRPRIRSLCVSLRESGDAASLLRSNPQVCKLEIATPLRGSQ